MAAKTKKSLATRPTPKEASEDQSLFLDLVREARKAGFTVEEIGRHLGKSIASVSRWANGISTPHENDADRLIPVLERLLR